jgi:hypothetical protein
MEVAGVTKEISFLATDYYRSLVLTFGVIVALVSIWSAHRTAKKKQTSDLILASRSDEKLVEGLQCIKCLHDDPNTSLRHYGSPEKKSDEKLPCMLYVLNYYESICVGVREGIYDEKMLKRAQCSQVIVLWERTEKLIEELRKTRAQPTMFCEFAWIGKRWKQSPLK